MYRCLDPDKTVRTIDILHRRIEERFPMSSLSMVCGELHLIANESKARSEWVSRPNYILRASVAVIILLSIIVLLYSISMMDISLKTIDAGELVQVMDAGLNDLVLIGAAIFFLITMETRIKRTRAISALHELRAVAHVIDMHQLTKDPSQWLNQMVLTPSSPKREMSAYELTRYLDYCSEMLSLAGKVAALYAQNFPDAVVLAAVNEVETLTTGLSRKIWQKIMILNKLDADTPHSTNKPDAPVISPG